MKKYYQKVKGLAFSSTAKDTYVLFGGNVSSAFLGFVYTLIVARALSVADFGTFSAAINFMLIVTSFSDLGISSGVVNFVASRLSKKDNKGSDEYIKAATVIRFVSTSTLSLLVIIFASFIARKFMATTDPSVAVWVGLVSIFMCLPMLFPFILQAKKKFLSSVIVDNSIYIVRLLAALGFLFLVGLNINYSLSSFVFGGIASTLIGIYLLKYKFLSSKPGKTKYVKLLKFSGWIGVNRIISSVSGRLDIQMLATMVGATATGLYSIPARLASFVIVLTSSFSAVLAPRLAGFDDKEKEGKYILKATLALLPIIAGLIFWIIIARPFITLLFGVKYLPAVPIFQALTAATIPFIFTAPSVTAIIYAMKKTVFIGAFSFFQVAAIFLLNLVLIPKYGVFGPTMTIGAVNTILAIYTWLIVIKHYWLSKQG